MKRILTVLSVLLLLVIPTNVAGGQDENNPNIFEYPLTTGTAQSVKKLHRMITTTVNVQKYTVSGNMTTSCRFLAW